MCRISVSSGMSGASGTGPFTGHNGNRGKDQLPKMRTRTEAAPAGVSPPEVMPLHGTASDVLVKDILHWLDEAKAEEIVSIPLAGKSSIGDHMVIASGRSDRHVGAIADQMRKKLKDQGYDNVRVEGLEACDWVLVDAGDVIIHIFRPEVRDFYNLEKMWSADRPGETAH
jgi:ribosome-associated protein